MDWQIVIIETGEIIEGDLATLIEVVLWEDNQEASWTTDDGKITTHAHVLVCK